jgi:hypothetical protein
MVAKQSVRMSTQSHIRSFEGIVAKNTEWRTLGETRPSHAAREASSA